MINEKRDALYKLMEARGIAEDRVRQRLDEKEIAEVLDSFGDIDDDERTFLDEKLRELTYEEDYVSEFCAEKVVYLFNQAMDKAACYLKYGYWRESEAQQRTNEISRR